MKHEFLKNIMNKYYRLLLYCLPYLLVFYSAIYFSQDPDLGWHLKYGEYFYHNGKILAENTFSHLMPGFHWINISWGIDVIDYFIFSNFGFLGLMILGALVITATFFFFSRAFKLTALEQAIIFPFLIFLEHVLINQSFKGQSVSILFLSLQTYLLEKYFGKADKKLIIFLMILYLFWTNINGQFLLGLGILVIHLAAKIFSDDQFKRNNKLLSIFKIFLPVCATTLINPYGIIVYPETLRWAFDSKSKLILEFQPIFASPSLFAGYILTAIFVLTSLAFIYTSNTFKKNLPYIVIAGVLFTAAYSINRYALSLYYFTIPFLKIVISSYIPRNFNKSWIIIIAILLLQIIYLFNTKNPENLFSNLTWSKYCMHFISCSPEAAEFIMKNNLQHKKIFTVYNWGGFLIWNYPQISPPIDGRMLMWKDEKGFSGFDYYYSITANKIDIDKTDYEVAMIDKSILSMRLLQLEKEKKWKLVYKDKKAFIFVRNK